jgi:hypothetical protein
MKMILSLLIILGSLNLSLSKKKSHHHKKYRVAHKKVRKTHDPTIVAALPKANVAGPYNQLEL